MEDLSLVFAKLCEQRSVKANKQMTEMLKGRSCMRLLDLDLSSVYLAKNIFPALGDFISFCNNLRALNLAYSGMDNASMEILVRPLAEHPSLTSLDVSHSELSFPAAKAILQLVKDNPNYVEVNVGSTDISAAYQERIALQCDLNRRQEVQKKHLAFDTGDQDGGVGRETLKIRQRLGLGPVGGEEDEEWEVTSNLSDCSDIQRREKDDERRRAEEGLYLGAPGRPEHPEDYPIELKVIPQYGEYNAADGSPGGLQPTPTGVAASPGAADAGGLVLSGTGSNNPNRLHDDSHIPHPARLQTNPLPRQNLSEITAELFGRAGAQWTDPAFPPSGASLISATTVGVKERERKLKGVSWRRLGTPLDPSLPPPRLFVNQSAPSLPIKGAMFANKYFVEVMALFTRHPQYLTHLFLKAQPDIGAYEVQLYKAGMWMRVVIDDYVPCTADGTLLGASNDDPLEFWAALLEKAYAKLHGGYDQMENGSSVMAMGDLLGALCHNIFIRNHQRAKEVLVDSTYWNTLRGYLLDGWVLSASVKTDSKTERLALDEVAIPSNAINEITRLVEFENLAIVQMYFPQRRRRAAGSGGSDVPTLPPISWGMGSLTGASQPRGGDGTPPAERPPGSVWLDPSWFDKLPDAAYKYFLSHCVVDPGEDPNDYRWITFEVFATFFNKVYVARTEGRSRHGKYAVQREQRVGRWLGRTAGGRLHSQYFSENPCYCLRVKDKDTPVLIQLAQPDCKLQRKAGYEHAIGLYIVKSMDGGRKKRYWKKEHALVAPKFVAYREVATEVLCQPYTNYFLIPSTARPKVEMPFMLTLMSQFHFAVEEVPAEKDVELKLQGKWEGLSAGGRVAGAPSWKNNPQFRLTVTEPGVFAFILHQKPYPRQGVHLYYISFNVYKTDGHRVVTHNKDAVRLDLEFQPFDSVFSECALEAGTYTVVPMTWEQGEEGDFELSVISSSQALMVPLNSLLA